MGEILSAVGKFANLGAEAASANAARRAQILQEADEAYHSWKAGVVGFWAGMKTDDEALDALAAPLPAQPAPVAAPAVPPAAPPVAPTPPVAVPQPTGVE